MPFCPESVLSGIGDTDFHNCVWYRKNIKIPAEWENKRIRLHFGAVDYDATVYVNGKEAGKHKGGYSSFVLDITDFFETRDMLNDDMINHTVWYTEETKQFNYRKILEHQKAITGVYPDILHMWKWNFIKDETKP